MKNALLNIVFNVLNYLCNVSKKLYVFRKWAKKLARMGPDFSKVYKDGLFGLGFFRLKINLKFVLSMTLR